MCKFIPPEKFLLQQVLIFLDRDLDEFKTTSNEAYNVVRRPGVTDGDYETVSVPREDLPPSTSY